jgi:hypothetical protein
MSNACAMPLPMLLSAGEGKGGEGLKREKIEGVDTRRGQKQEEAPWESVIPPTLLLPKHCRQTQHTLHTC